MKNKSEFREKDVIEAVAGGKILIIKTHNHLLDGIKSVIGPFKTEGNDRVIDGKATPWAFKIWVGNVYYQYAYESEKETATAYMKVLAVWHNFLTK